MKIAIGCDHIVVDEKNSVKKFLEEKGMKLLMLVLMIKQEHIIQFLKKKLVNS